MEPDLELLTLLVGVTLEFVNDGHEVAHHLRKHSQTHELKHNACELLLLVDGVVVTVAHSRQGSHDEVHQQYDSFRHGLQLPKVSFSIFSAQFKYGDELGHFFFCVDHVVSESVPGHAQEVGQANHVDQVVE